MAWEGSSFNLFNDTSLTSPFSGIESIINKTNLSDNPQDFILYLGSLTSGRQLRDYTSPGVDDIIITPVDTLPHWEATTAYVLGDRVQTLAGGDFVYKCTTAGTSDSSEPSWPVSGFGSTVTDGSIIWTLLSDHHHPDEITLALNSGDLDTNIPGDPLALGTTVDSLIANEIPIYIRVVNAVTSVSNSTGHAETGLQLSSVIEVSV